MALPTSPPDLADTSISIIGCLFSFTIYVIILSIPFALLVGTFLRFLVVKRSATGEHLNQEFVDELMSATIYSFFIALLIFLVFKFSEYWGVPVSKIIKDAFEVDKLFPDYNLRTCKAPMDSPIKFFLSVFSASLRLALAFAPLLALVFIFIRRMVIASEMIQRGQSEPTSEYAKAVVYAGFLGLAIIILINITLRIIGVDYVRVVDSTLNAIVEYVKGGG